MTISVAFFLGILQGVAEFLPISSSGHLAVVRHFFGISHPPLLFDMMLHVGSLTAMIWVYRKTLGRLLVEFFLLLGDLLHGRFRWSEMSSGRRLLLMLFLGTLPLFLLFLSIPGTDLQMRDLAEYLAADESVVLEGAALLFTSLILFSGIRINRKIRVSRIVTNREGQLVESKGRRKIHGVDALLIGLMQWLSAMFPGISRSGSTLSVGLMRGLRRQTALDYSFVLGIPAILAASLMSFQETSAEEIAAVGVAPLVVGTLVSCLVGLFSIRLLRRVVVAGRLRIFAYYTLIAGGLVFIFGMIESITEVPLFR